MPISGSIRPAAGPQSTPTPQAARDAATAREAQAIPGAAAPAAPRVDGAAALAAPPKVDGAAPAAAPAEPKVDAWRIEALARKERESTQALLAAKAEREALSRDRAAFDARAKSLEDRESRVNALEQRLQSYRYNPHLALQDLGQFGVTFEQLAQAVAQGAASPEQIAAAEAAAARRDVEDLRRRQEESEQSRVTQEEQRRKEEVAARQRDAREREERDRRAAAQAEAEATAQWKSELAREVAKDPGHYPIMAARADRGAVDLAFQWAEDFLAKQGRVPDNAEVLEGVETMLEAEAAELQSAVAAGRGSAPAPRRPPAALSNDMGPAPRAFAQPGRRGPPDEAERKARTIQALDRILGRAP
jgi:hypothetical protein